MARDGGRISRRTVLRGLGVALALPPLEAMASVRAASPLRLVAINVPLGFHSPHFFPKNAGRGYALSPYLEIAAKVRDTFTVVSGSSHPGVDGGHSAEKSFLTAAPHPGSRSFKNAISLDQFVARRLGGQTRFASLTLGDQSLSWSSNGVSIPSLRSPARAFERLFLTGGRKETAAQRKRLEDGRSIMDTVLADAAAMKRKIGPVDRDKLDQYFTAVRETEARLKKSESWVDTPKPKVEEPAPGRFDGADVTGRLRGHLQVARLALQTDSTRVVAVGGNNGSLVPPLKGVDMGYHGLTHHGKNPQMIRQLEIIERETLGIWVEFLAGLKEIREEGARLLDRTQVLFGSNLGNANGHLTTNLPIVLAGGRFKHGAHLAFDSKRNVPLCNLFVSMLRGLGLEADRFGSSTGPLAGLETTK